MPSQSRVQAVAARPELRHVCTSCPAIVRYVELYRPELISTLTPVVSPMIVHGRLLKKRLGEETAVVFIGPCAAKKREAQRPENAGAVEFLTKPFRDQDLLDAIQHALDRDRATRQEQAEIATLQQRFDTLTSREREVLDLVISGMSNKQIAAELGTSEVTVKIQRGHAMHKMQAESLAALFRMAHKVGLPTGKWLCHQYYSNHTKA